MDVAKNADGVWRVWDFQSDPPSKLTASSDFCIGRGTIGCRTIRKQMKDTTANQGKEAA